MKKEEVRKAVREGYAKVAKGGSSCCTSNNSCCGASTVAADISKKIGYSTEELNSVLEGANLGLGCGNPVALASLKEGEIVLDLGSGAGFDCFLAANRVGETGRVIGVDMTPEMLEKARENARKGDFKNVEFRLGEIENLPVADNHVDVIISNCVINLSLDKARVFKEAFRVLKPGGRLMVSDVVLLKELPKATKSSVAAYISCISGAIIKDEYIGTIKAAGFQSINIISEDAFKIDFTTNDSRAQALAKDYGIPQAEIENISSSVRSMKIQAVKP